MSCLDWMWPMEKQKNRGKTFLQLSKMFWVLNIRYYKCTSHAIVNVTFSSFLQWTDWQFISVHKSSMSALHMKFISELVPCADVSSGTCLQLDPPPSFSAMELCIKFLSGWNNYLLILILGAQRKGQQLIFSDWTNIPTGNTAVVSKTQAHFLPHPSFLQQMIIIRQVLYCVEDFLL